MKTISLLFTFACLLGATPAFSQSNPATPAAGRVGVYDSRAVAYAYFWGDAGSRERNALLSAAKAARVAGDQERLKSLSGQLKALQRRNHLQVFSTAPVDEAFVALAPTLPALRAELGVDRFASKWDEAALRTVPPAAQVDVTDRLVQALFTPTPQQAKILASMKGTAPLPLAQAEVMADAGQL